MTARRAWRVGIVGCEAAKFTIETETYAKGQIRQLLTGASAVVSGACHLGGIDVWAAEEGRKMGLRVIEYAPATQSWEGGYKPRNLLIAEASQAVYCITLRELPESYTGMRFKLCYHCGTADHVKSGGCWTVKQAKKMGKPTGVIVI